MCLTLYFVFLPSSYPACHVGHFLYQMSAFCTRIASLCPGPGDLQHHATALHWPYSELRVRTQHLLNSYVCFLISSSQSHWLNCCELYWAAKCFKAGSTFGCLVSYPPSWSAAMCIITLCTIHLLCTIALGRNTLAVLYLIHPHGRHQHQIDKKQCSAAPT